MQDRPAKEARASAVEPPPHALGHIEVEQVLIRLGFHLDDVSFHELFDEVDGDGDGHSTSTMKPRPNPWPLHPDPALPLALAPSPDPALALTPTTTPSLPTALELCPPGISTSTSSSR